MSSKFNYFAPKKTTQHSLKPTPSTHLNIGRSLYLSLGRSVGRSVDRYGTLVPVQSPDLVFSLHSGIIVQYSFFTVECLKDADCKHNYLACTVGKCTCKDGLAMGNNKSCEPGKNAKQ